MRHACKTSLCQSTGDIDHYDYELPSVRRQSEDPELFLSHHNHKRIVLDETHRLSSPCGPLKIAADQFVKQELKTSY